MYKSSRSSRVNPIKVISGDDYFVLLQVDADEFVSFFKLEDHPSSDH